jgi:hypothetical protein
MGNYRSGSLVLGQAFPSVASNATILFNLQKVNVTTPQPPISTLYVRSNSISSTSRTFVLTSGAFDGQQINIIFDSDAPLSAALVSSSNCVLNQPWNAYKGSLIRLMWNQSAGLWVEMFRDSYQTTLVGNLTQTQIKNMNTSMQVVIPAQGAGTMTIIDEAHLHYDYTGVAWTNANPTSTLGLRYGIGPGTGTVITIMNQSFLTGSASASTVLKPNIYTSSATNTGFLVNTSTAENRAVSFRSAGPAFVGTSTQGLLYYEIKYRISTLLT